MEQDIATQILQNQIELRKVNAELERQSEVFKAQIALRDQLNQSIEEAKAKLKETAPLGKITKKLGEDELSVNIWTTTRVSEANIEEIPDHYITEEEIYNVVERDGHYYQKKGNTELVKNELKLGMDCPPGFMVKENRSISIKFNGKAL